MSTPKVSGKLLLNVLLTFAYFFAGAVAVSGQQELDIAAVVAAIAAAVRLTIGAFALNSGAPIPVDK